MTKKAKLNIRQEKFVSAYLKSGNATQSAIEAGYSAKTAAEQASRLLTNINVAKALEVARAKMADKLEISAEKVLRRFERWASADPRKLYDKAGRLIPPHQMDDDTAALVAEIEVSERAGGETIRRIKRVDPLAANNSLARAMGLFKDKLELSGSVDLAAKLDAARRRAGK